jgi:hypothetical protein
VPCGIDWAAEHHDVAVIDVDGRVAARGRVSDDAVGYAQPAQKPNGIRSTNSSANSIIASAPVGDTTNTWRFHLL